MVSGRLPGPAARALGASLGLVLDEAVGDPPAFHPVAGFGRTMAALERRCWRDRRGPGVGYALAGLAIGVGAGQLGREVAGELLASAAAATVAVAARQLRREALAVEAALVREDLAEARRRLPALCGRDPEALGHEALCRAVCESVAENTVDAVVGPLLWAALGGAAGALGYRAVNTLDAMVGHRSPRYWRFGWASARLDDLAGWLPARVTAAAVGCLRPTRFGAIRRAVTLDARAHPSPNAGVAEAAFAAALGVRLGGPVSYGGRLDPRPWLHPSGQPCAPASIGAAVALSRQVGWLLAGLLGLAGLSTGRTR
jgi:adenosylcobinamide-phosphate synthase